MQFSKIKKILTSISGAFTAVMIKISLFFNPYLYKAFFVALVVFSLFSTPFSANAGFFSFIGDVFGVETSAFNEPNEEINLKNSQNMALLEPSLTPDLKNQYKESYSTIIENEALQSQNGPLGPNMDIDKLAVSTEKINAYTVQKGDTLESIAKKFKVSKNTIIYSNSDIKTSELIKVGQTLTILPVDGVVYTVKSGDTLSGIALEYGAKSSDIAEYNRIIKNSDLQIGDSIVIPGGIAKKEPEKNKIVKKKEQEKVSNEKPKKVATVLTNEELIESNVSSKTEPQNNNSSSTNKNGYIWPFPEGVGRISQGLHDDRAVDLAAPMNTPIYAIADGEILIARGSGYNGGFGLYVVENFENGAQAIYGHMSKVVAVAGQKVKQGDLIGYVGSTGKSTGPHVHIGFRGGFKNPFEKLPTGSTSKNF